MKPAIILSHGDKAHRQIVKALFAAGAHVNHADGDGVTPLQHARQRGHAAIASLLQKAGAR
jgi:hypothetical protein